MSLGVVGDSIAIKAKWLDNTTVEITIPENVQIRTQDEKSCIFKSCVEIKYNEE